MNKLQKLKVFQSIPKLELHAHLFGSIMPYQLVQLLREKGLDQDASEYQQLLESLNLELIFSKAFAYLPKVAKSSAEVAKITQLVLENFISDNVIYLEIRTSPKTLSDGDVAEYYATIINVIKEYEPKIISRLLVSINRDYPPDCYKDIIPIIHKVPNWQKYIIGFDFSGNPEKYPFRDYIALFNQIKEQGFKVTVHTAESQSTMDEISDILEHKPDRLGHFIYYSEEHLKKAIDLQIPIEICPTSNFIVGTTKCHHFIDLINTGLKHYTVCTDDLLLYNSKLSNEWCLFADESNISLKTACIQILKSVEYIFDQSIKQSLRQEISYFIEQAFPEDSKVN